MSAIDYVVRASRPASLTDSLGYALEIARRANERQASEISLLRGEVKRVTLDYENAVNANLQLWREKADALKELNITRAELTGAREQVRDLLAELAGRGGAS